MKQLIKEAKRFQELAGIVTEQETGDENWEFQLVIEPGYLDDNEEDEAIQVYINWYNEEEDDFVNIDEHPDPKVVTLQNYLKSSLWTLNPLEEYHGDADFTFDTITHVGSDGNIKYLGERIFEFNNTSELEDFLKNDYMEVLQTEYGK